MVQFFWGGFFFFSQLPITVEQHCTHKVLSRTYTYNIAFPLLRPHQLIGIICITFGSFPLVQNIQKKNNSTKPNKKKKNIQTEIDIDTLQIHPDPNTDKTTVHQRPQ